MSRNLNKLTILFVTQILLILQVRQRITIAKSELNFDNLNLQQFLSSPFIVEGNLTQVFEDAHVVGYVGKGVEPAVRWPFELASKIWNYVKKTYGNFGDDGHLYVCLRSKKTTLQDNYLDIQFFLSNLTFPPNFLECGSDSGWGEINEADGILCLARQVSDLVMAFAKGTVDTNSLLNMRNGDCANHLQPILIYDFLIQCGHKQLAESYRQTSLTVFHSTEQINESYLVQDLLFQIYSQYGGANVINKFFKNRAKYFPRNLNTEFKINYWKYERLMTTGEFVHFWSGAANVNLRDQFSKLVKWNVVYEAQLRKAQEDFPQMKYLCPSCGAVLGNYTLTYSSAHDEITRPKMTVHFKKVHFSQPYNYNATFEKRAPVYLYETKFKSIDRHLPVHRYDNHNPLYIVETEQDACYTVTCASTYLTKWVTDILVKDVGREFEPLCGNWMYMNSLRFKDKYDLIDRNKASTSALYTIRFTFRAYKSNMGLLSCQNIANSSSASHYFFYPVFEKTKNSQANHLL